MGFYRHFLGNQRAFFSENLSGAECISNSFDGNEIDARNLNVNYLNTNN